MAHSRLPIMHATAVLITLSVSYATTAVAHHPDRKSTTVRPRVDVIGPIGSRLAPSMRRTHNRPTYLGGKVAYWIAPTSQEAMVWHKADHQGAYRNACPPIEPRYFYPKPWEAMRIGPRVSLKPSDRPIELKSLKDITLDDPNAEPDQLSLPVDEPTSLRDDVIGSGIDEAAIQSLSDRSDHEETRRDTGSPE